MKKYNGLLSDVAQKHHIYKGEHESENDWKTRLVYSICGMMAYASLWDKSDDETDDESISIAHLKNRIRDMLSSYRSLYPELDGSLPFASEELEDEIANLFINTGVVYHRPNRMTPAALNEKAIGNIYLQRGISVDNISCVSGFGFYSTRSGPSNPRDIEKMFGLEREDLSSLWNSTVTSATWQTNISLEQNMEYLRLKPPFSQGYWVNTPDKHGRISILRSGQKGSQLYYLYRYKGSTLDLSPLPKRQVESYSYRALSSACLSSYGLLPPIDYFAEGALVHFRMNYLLPPRELEFLKLYSWPEVCTSLPCNFKRKCSKEVFDAVREILLRKGYEFVKGVL